MKMQRNTFRICLSADTADNCVTGYRGETMVRTEHPQDTKKRHQAVHAVTVMLVMVGLLPPAGPMKTTGIPPSKGRSLNFFSRHDEKAAYSFTTEELSGLLVRLEPLCNQGYFPETVLYALKKRISSVNRTPDDPRV